MRQKVKTIVETVDEEIYFELTLTGHNMDLLDDGRMLKKVVKIGQQLVNFSLRKETREEMYEG